MKGSQPIDMTSRDEFRTGAVRVGTVSVSALCAAVLCGIPGVAHASTGSDGSTEDEGATGDGDIAEFSIVSVNDFHGRLEESASTIACTVDRLREDSEVLFVSAGDNIGASTFTSFIQNDEPTIAALNAMGLDVSVAGNHEFDQGAADFDDRVIPLSDFPWITANARDAAGEHLYEPYVIEEVAGVRVAFIGAITESMPSLVNPDGITGIEWTSMAEETARYAEEITEQDLADVVTVLVHEGIPGTELSATAGTPFGDLLDTGISDVDAVFSGHTHQAYVHQIGDTWLGQGGEYGEYLTVLDLSVDNDSGEIVESEMDLLDLSEESGDVCSGHTEVDQIVADAVAVADELGSEVVASVTGDIPFARAENADGSENRGAASALGRLVADAQLWAAQEQGAEVDFALTNSGGLRADLPLGELSVRNLGDVQPFANTLSTVTLTGSQVHTLFEQQWRADGRFSRHGQSSNVEYTYDPQAPEGERITTVWIDGEAVQSDAEYRITMNSYMAGGGDGFSVVNEALSVEDSGLNDLEAFVEYARETAELSPSLARGSLGVHWISDPDEVYGAGDEISVDLSSLAFSSPDIPVGDTVEVSLNGVSLGEFEIDEAFVENTDERGQAQVRATVTEEMLNDVGTAELLISEPVTGTEVSLEIAVAAPAGEDDDDAGAGDGGGDSGTDSPSTEPPSTASPTTASTSAAPTSAAPSDTNSPAASDEPSAAPSADAAGTDDTGALARTGSTVLILALIAAALIPVGIFLLRWRSARRG